MLHYETEVTKHMLNQQFIFYSDLTMLVAGYELKRKITLVCPRVAISLDLCNILQSTKQAFQTKKQYERGSCL